MPHLLLILLLFLQASVAYAAGTDVLLARRDGRQTHVRLYGDWSRCLPTLILSHGLGGNSSALAYIADAAIEHGYRAAVMGHAESGRSALKQVLLTPKADKAEALLNPVFWQGRFDDIEATFAYATAQCRPPLLVMAGHSLGAATTVLEAGAKGAVSQVGKDRFDAYIALSPQGVGWIFKDSSAWGNIKKPVLLITGTEDFMVDGDYQDRVKAFDYLPSGSKRIVIINGADHKDFGGRGRNNATQQTTTKAIFDFLAMLQQKSWRAVSYPNATVKDE
ncbi:MAG: hypothetical protein EBV03_02505 [Proteobacteria bacterium]|nr:hypothetical protein [Pseudomonadota bacterium]